MTPLAATVIPWAVCQQIAAVKSEPGHQPATRNALTPRELTLPSRAVRAGLELGRHVE
jgi:hypothetical protein